MHFTRRKAEPCQHMPVQTCHANLSVFFGGSAGSTETRLETACSAAPTDTVTGQSIVPKLTYFT